MKRSILTSVLTFLAAIILTDGNFLQAILVMCFLSGAMLIASETEG